MNFTIKTYPKNIPYVNQILESCVSILRSTPISNQDEQSMKLLVKLLSIPLESLFIAVLDMNHYPTLMQYMRFANKRTVALRIVKAVINDKNPLISPKTVDQLIAFIMPLLEEEKGAPQEEPYEFEEGQEAVAKLVHLVRHPRNNDLIFDILMKFKKVFIKGGTNRLKYTCPALIFALFRLSNQLAAAQSGYIQQFEETKIDDEVYQAKVKVTQALIFKGIAELVELIKSQYPELSLRLLLQSAEAINRLPEYQELEEEAYSFCTDAISIYEQELSDADIKFQAINLIVATIFTLGCFGPDNQDALVSSTVSYCSKLLKKPSQCEALIFAGQLYYRDYQKQGNKALDCMRRAAKIAQLSMSQPKNLYLYPTILNKYLYYFSIDADFVRVMPNNVLGYFG